MSDAVVKAVVGLRRYGKSSHVVRLTSEVRRVVFYDTLNDDYNQGIVCREWDEFQKLWLASYRGNFRITYKPVDPMADFQKFCSLAYECGDCTIVLDEVQLYFRGTYCEQSFTKLITAGGHRNVGLIGVTQSPKRLGELLRSQAHEWHVFALREETHVKYVTDRCPGLHAETIKHLPKYEYLHFVDGADCYCWCKDDLNSAYVNRQRMEYEGPTVAPGPIADSSEHEGASGSVGGELADSASSLSCSPTE